MGVRAAVLILVLATLPVPAAGEIYRWVDASGNVHFTADLTQVPPDQRPGAAHVSPAGRGSVQRVIERQTPAEPNDQPPANASSAGGSARAPAAAAQEERFGGRSEAEWRALARKYRDAIERLEPRAQACESDSFRWTPGAGRAAYREEAAEAEACSRVRNDLDTNRRGLEKLEESAHRAGAPPGWLRE